MATPDGFDDRSILEQRALWRRQVATLPTLHGGKQSWLRLALALVDQVNAGAATAMETRPELPPLFNGTSRKGATASFEPLTWGEYSRFLKASGLAQVINGNLKLTNAGHNFRLHRSAEFLGAALTSQLRLLAEALAFIARDPATVDALDRFLRESYRTEWKSLSGARLRADWLDALGAIEAVEERRWRITPTGKHILAQSVLVSPDAIASPLGNQQVQLPEAPRVIADLLDELETGTRSHIARSTYNIWAPSPGAHPNKVENLRVIVNAAIDPIEREEFFQFIEGAFSLRRSSVESMLPFLRASGLIREVGLGVFRATPAALAWLESGDDVNFIRILHTHMRFIGEMLRVAQDGAERAEIYEIAKTFGLNVEKTRWVAAFLQDTNLIEPPRYGSLRTTALGKLLLAELPLAEGDDLIHPDVPQPSAPRVPVIETHEALLGKLSRSPMAMEQSSGKAFEYAIRDAFLAMGFEAKCISGSGATDVLVRWVDSTGNARVAIVEAKSRASGNVSHTDVSDVAIETHKTHHGASGVAIVAPGFAGDTIKNMAVRRGWALLEASDLGRITDEASHLGIEPSTIGQLFTPTTGLDNTLDAIRARRREMDVLSFVVEQLAEEAAETGDAITPRDISRDGRRTSLQPTLDEVLAALEVLHGTTSGAILNIDKNEDPRFSSYVLGHARSSASRLRAIADAIERSFASNA